MIPDPLKASEARLSLAYDRVSSSEDGQIVLSDILNNLFHLSETREAEAQALQQFAQWLLRRSRLFPQSRGSFPLEYVQALQRLKLLRQDPDSNPPEPVVPVGQERRPGFWGRLLKRII